MDWDLNGNLKQRKDLKLSPNVTEDFYYDALDRFDYSQRTPAGGATSTNADVTLDAIGNIQWKQGVGNYAYHATQMRAVVSAGSNSYGYDANGNMNVRNGANIGYTSYNLPNVINAPGGYSSTISYGAFRNRFKQVAIGPQGTETTIYVAGLLEKVSNASGTHYRHYIRGGAGTAAIHSRTVGGANTTVYLHRDHLGSPELITDASGNVLVRPSFAAYGERRDGADWDGPISSANLDTLAGISRRGFTGHEHLDAVGLIHMNGRVFEPVAGRFLSVDPYIDGWASSQGPNGYAYVHNTPLSLIDPSGFLTATRYADVERRCEVICFSVGQKFPFLDLFGEPDWTDRWRTIPNPFVQVQPQQSQQLPLSPHETWDGHLGGETGVRFGAGTTNHIPGELTHRGRSTPETRRQTVMTAADWLIKQGIIDYVPKYEDKWRVRFPDPRYPARHTYETCDGTDPYCGIKGAQRTGAKTEGITTTVYRNGVEATGREGVLVTGDPPGQVRDIGDLTPIERAMHVLAHEQHHRKHRGSTEWDANAAAYEAIERYRAWKRQILSHWR